MILLLNSIVHFCNYAGVRLSGCATAQSQRYAILQICKHDYSIPRTLLYSHFFYTDSSLCTKQYWCVTETYMVILDDLLFCVVAGAKILIILQLHNYATAKMHNFKSI